MLYSVRTDMADEAHRLYHQSAGDQTALAGVEASEETLCGLSVSAVHILDERGAQALGRPAGNYYTLCLPGHFDRGSDSFVPAVRALSRLLRRCLPESCDSVLVAALGNPDITPDALGSLAASSVLVTRHLKSSDPADFVGFSSLALCRPGVLGTSGMESSLQISLLASELKPRALIVIDALAGSDAGRLCRSVQVCDTGISPGSGVGNDRAEISPATLGVPVVCVGVPTVIDAGMFGGETLAGMFVTPRDIDSLVRRAARVIGYGIDLAVHPGITIEDIDILSG